MAASGHRRAGLHARERAKALWEARGNIVAEGQRKKVTVAWRYRNVTQLAEFYAVWGLGGAWRGALGSFCNAVRV